MRQYAPIWKKLKETGECRISAPKALHARIIRAVIKEKNLDVGYKYQLQEESKRARIVKHAENAIIYFTLVKSIGITDL